MLKPNDKIVYDFGMNNGDDVDYYLRKGCVVIGVEANPLLVDSCRSRFEKEIGKGAVVLLNFALSRESSDELIPFYVHKTNHVLSQVTLPQETDQFETVFVRQRRASDIIRQYGDPHYIKIDLELFDQIVLADIFDHGFRPQYISAESHTVDVFVQMVAAGYTAFNLVDGVSVHSVYRNAKILTQGATLNYQFPHHSAGPFGEDIVSPWMDKESFFYYLASVGLGWKDIHATLLDVPTSRQRRVIVSFRQLLSSLMPSYMVALLRRLRSLRSKLTTRFTKS